jgi:DNA-binding response OmpR family regulator
MARILVVDDDPDIVESTRLFLEAEGHEVLTAGSRREGMKAISKKPDLIILDVMMEEPDDGMVMAQELRRQNFRKPILMLTAISRVTRLNYNRDDEMVPVDAFLEKPADPVVLLKMVEDLLGRKTGG